VVVEVGVSELDVATVEAKMFEEPWEDGELNGQPDNGKARRNNELNRTNDRLMTSHQCKSRALQNSKNGIKGTRIKRIDSLGKLPLKRSRTLV